MFQKKKKKLNLKKKLNPFQLNDETISIGGNVPKINHLS